MSEPYYAEWDREPPDWYPGDYDDTGWPYPDSDNPAQDIPSVPTFRYVDDELYDRITDDDTGEYETEDREMPDYEDDPVETDDPDDIRGWR